jgi:hypothetical protein
MSASLADRLNQILPRITSEAFLSSEGIGNEIAFYIFDYPAKDELQVRKHVRWMLDRLTTHHAGLRVLYLNMFDIMLEYLKDRGLYDKALQMEASRGDEAVLQALKGPLAADKVVEFISSVYKLSEYDLVMVAGIGSVWPVLRAHNLLNCLHPVMGKTPLVMFYPGTFNGTTLHLFGQVAVESTRTGTNPYYRAFILIPGDTQS